MRAANTETAIRKTVRNFLPGQVGIPTGYALFIRGIPTESEFYGTPTGVLKHEKIRGIPTVKIMARHSDRSANKVTAFRQLTLKYKIPFFACRGDECAAMQQSAHQAGP